MPLARSPEARSKGDTRDCHVDGVRQMGSARARAEVTRAGVRFLATTIDWRRVHFMKMSSHGLGLVAAFPLFGDGFGDGFGEASALPASRSLSFQYPNVASLVMTSSKPSSRSSRSAAGVAALGGEGASRGAAFAGVESDAEASSRRVAETAEPPFGAPPFPTAFSVDFPTAFSVASTGPSTLSATRATGDAGAAGGSEASAGAAPADALPSALAPVVGRGPVRRRDPPRR